jgi:hypothetical protein
MTILPWNLEDLPITSLGYWLLDHTVEEVEERHYGHRGRARKDEQPRVERYFRLVIKPSKCCIMAMRI